MPLALLSGCATAPIDSGLSVIERPAIEKKAADEVLSNACPAMTQLLIDAMILRDQARVK